MFILLAVFLRKDSSLRRMGLLLLSISASFAASARSGEPHLVNIARPEWGTRVTATSAYSDDYAPRRAVDGQVDNPHAWLSKDHAELPQHLEFRFHQDWQVSRVRLVQPKWGGKYAARDFRVEISPAGRTWRTVGKGRLPESDGAETEVEFKPTRARAVRITILSSYNAVQTCGLAEVEVMAVMDPATPAPFADASETIAFDMGRALLKIEPMLDPAPDFWLPDADNSPDAQTWRCPPHTLHLKVEHLSVGQSILRCSIERTDGKPLRLEQSRIDVRTSQAGVYKIFHSGSMAQQSYGVDLPFRFLGYADAIHGIPVIWMQDTSGQNTLTVGALDQIGRTRYEASTYNLGNGGEAPGIANCYAGVVLTRPYDTGKEITRHEDAFYLNENSAVTWDEALRAYAAAVDTERGYTPPEGGQAAKEPLWHTWYAHADLISQESVLTDARIAAKLGFKAFQIDAGWNVAPDVHYALIREGDYLFDPLRFPDPKAMLDEMHELGLRVSLHVSPLIMGVECRNYEQMQDTMIHVNGNPDNHMDPRLRKTHDFLIETWATLLKQYPIDGLWYDFLEIPEHPDAPAAGMEVIDANLTTAYDRLMRSLYETARTINPDVIISIRRSTANLAAKRSFTHFWPMDSPQDYNMNRRDVVFMRTYGPGVLTYSCCTSWPISESEKNVARQMASVVLAGIPSVSVPLTISPESHNTIIRAWLDFYHEHTDALSLGHLTPLLPTPPSAAIRIEHDQEAFFGFFEAVPGLVCVSRPVDSVTLVNAFSDRLATRVEGLNGSFHVRVYDREWALISEFDRQADTEGGVSLNIPEPSGCFSVVLSRD